MHIRSLLPALLLCLWPACDGALVHEDELPGAPEVPSGRRVASSFDAGDLAVVCETGGLGLRQRTGPGLGYTILRAMPEGTQVRILEAGPGWYKNDWDGKEGWSFGDYLCPVDEASEEPAPAEPAPQPEPPQPEPQQPEPQQPEPQQPPSGRLTLSQIVGGSYHVSQDYGPTSFWWNYSYCQSYGHWSSGVNVHCAVDLGIERGRTLYAPAAGVVITAGGTPYYTDDFNAAAGELKIRLSDGTHVIFGHTSRIDVWKGQTVSAGQQIGASGTAGTGAHLHLEVRVPGDCAAGYCTTDPVTYFAE